MDYAAEPALPERLAAALDAVLPALSSDDSDSLDAVSAAQWQREAGPHGRPKRNRSSSESPRALRDKTRKRKKYKKSRRPRQASPEAFFETDLRKGLQAQIEYARVRKQERTGEELWKPQPPTEDGAGPSLECLQTGHACRQAHDSMMRKEAAPSAVCCARA